MSQSAHSSQPRRDVYADITARLVAAIEADPGKPSLPWRRSSAPLFMPVNALTGNAYNGINVVSLWVSAECRQFTAPVWATYKQWQEMDCQVRQGETSSLVVFYKEYEVVPEARGANGPKPDDAEDNGRRRVARASSVFNASQVDGYTAPDAPPPLGPIDRMAAADRFVAATGARIEHGGERAFYRPSTDAVHMPDEDLFCGTGTMDRSEGYYATLIHELTHYAAFRIMPRHGRIARRCVCGGGVYRHNRAQLPTGISSSRLARRQFDVGPCSFQREEGATCPGRPESPQPSKVHRTG